MSNYADFLVSFFSLVKNNNGFFKSEKQAAFLLKMTDGHYVTSQNIQFGEYEGRTNRNTAKIEWAVILDNKGVVKMEKTTSKGTQVYFERTQEFFDKVAAKKAAMLADMEATKAGRNAFICGKIAELLNEVKAAERELDIAEENKQTLTQTPSPLSRHANMYDYSVTLLARCIADFKEQIKKLEAEKE